LSHVNSALDEVDESRRAQSFGAVAQEYERGRPGYPPSAIRWLLGERPLDVVDLGAGTGKLTAALVAAGHRVVAVEPLAEMRAVLSERVPEAGLVAGNAEDTGLEAGGADAVVAGAAFHWFDRSRAFPEILRILRPGGTLGLLGNGFDPATSGWIEGFRQITGSQRQGRPGHWPEADELGAWFDSIEDGVFSHAHAIDRAQLLDLAVSRSRVALLGPDDRAALLERIEAMWDRSPELRGREQVELAYLTRVRRARVRLI
jgi:SAM-dependent methyltransferase